MNHEYIVAGLPLLVVGALMPWMMGLSRRIGQLEAKVDSLSEKLDLLLELRKL